MLQDQNEGAGKFCAGENPLAGSQTGLLPASSPGGRGKAPPWGLFYKGTHPVPEGSTLMT